MRKGYCKTAKIMRAKTYSLGSLKTSPLVMPWEVDDATGVAAGDATGVEEFEKVTDSKLTVMVGGEDVDLFPTKYQYLK